MSKKTKKFETAATEIGSMFGKILKGWRFFLNEVEIFKDKTQKRNNLIARDGYLSNF